MGGLYFISYIFLLHIKAEIGSTGQIRDICTLNYQAPTVLKSFNIDSHLTVFPYQDFWRFMSHFSRPDYISSLFRISSQTGNTSYNTLNLLFKSLGHRFFSYSLVKYDLLQNRSCPNVKSLFSDFQIIFFILKRFFKILKIYCAQHNIPLTLFAT